VRSSRLIMALALQAPSPTRRARADRGLRIELERQRGQPVDSPRRLAGLAVVFTTVRFGQGPQGLQLRRRGLRGDRHPVPGHDRRPTRPTRSLGRPYAYLPIVARRHVLPYQSRGRETRARPAAVRVTLAKIFMGQITNGTTRRSPPTTKGGYCRRSPSSRSCTPRAPARRASYLVLAASFRRCGQSYASSSGLTEY